MIRLRCPVHLCKGRRAVGHLFCRNCWSALPAWLRDAIGDERADCRASRIQHSQKLLELRDQATTMLSTRNQQRFARPQGEQLALPTT